MHSSFGVDDAHALSTTQSRKALGERKIFIVIFQTMTIEAQNALLKTLEEPTENTHFFFVTKNAVTLLSTLRSRMYFIRLEHKNTKKHDHDGEKFLRMSIPERMQFIEDFTKAKTDEKAKAKESVSIFLDELLLALYEKFDVHPEFHEALLDVLTAKRYLLDRSPSVKILLEHLVLTIPQQEK